MEFDITKVIEAIFTLICVCITTFLIPYIKSKTSKETQEKILALIKIAVSAAEQLYAGKGRGEEKKQYVVEWLQARNIKYDHAKIDAMIEAAVYELKQNTVLLPEAILDTTVE